MAIESTDKSCSGIGTSAELGNDLQKLVGELLARHSSELSDKDKLIASLRSKEEEYRKSVQQLQKERDEVISHLQTEQLLKMQAEIKLAEIMSRNDLDITSKTAQAGNLMKKERECRMLQQQLEQEKEKFNQMTLKWQRDLQELQAAMNEKNQMELDSRESEMEIHKGWLSIPDDQYIRMRRGWRDQYVVMSSRAMIFYNYNSGQDRQNPTRVVDIRKIFRVRAVTQGDVIRANDADFSRIFEIIYAEDDTGINSGKAMPDDTQERGTLFHKGHALDEISFHVPTTCEVCPKPLWHMFRPPPALECRRCRVKIHKEHYGEDVMAPCQVKYDPSTAKQLLLLASNANDQKEWISKIGKIIQKGAYEAGGDSTSSLNVATGAEIGRPGSGNNFTETKGRFASKMETFPNGSKDVPRGDHSVHTNMKMEVPNKRRANLIFQKQPGESMLANANETTSTKKPQDRKQKLAEICNRMETQMLDGTVNIGVLTKKVVVGAIKQARLVISEGMEDDEVENEIYDLFKSLKFK